MKRALTSSGVQVTGQDAGEVIRRVIARNAERIEAQELALKQRESRYKYDEREEIWCLVKTTTSADGTTWYSAESVGQVPDCGCHVRTDRHERSAKLALTELRFKIAKIWSARKVETPESARERASKLEFRQAIIGAHDSAGDA